MLTLARPGVVTCWLLVMLALAHLGCSAPSRKLPDWLTNNHLFERDSFNIRLRDSRQDEGASKLRVVPGMQLPQRLKEDNRTFGVIVDCGSSGTRAHLYEWDGSISYPELLHDIEPMREASGVPVSRKFFPSLSSFADDPLKELEQYIQGILDYIELHIPRKKHPFTGVYILATAGMRLLDDDKQARIMKDIAHYIKEHYNFAKVRTNVISGAHEGMYQWISVNAKARRFLGQGTTGRTKTYAVIEMGGASIQVTYQLRTGVSAAMTNRIKKEEVRDVYQAQIVEPQLSRHDKPENTFMLHSTTFLGFGSNSAREAYLDLLLHKTTLVSDWRNFLNWPKKMLLSCFHPETGERENPHQKHQELVLEDPCSPKGFVSEEPLRKPKRLLEQKQKAKSKILGYILDEDEPYFEYRVYGTGNYAKCKKLVGEMLMLAKLEKLNCKREMPEQCTMSLIGEHFIPFESIDFLGIGDIYHTTHLMIHSDGIYMHDEVSERTKIICNMPYQQLIELFPNLFNNKQLKSRVSDECFKAVWVDTFLMKALKLPMDSFTLKTVNKIYGDELEWTLGAVLDKSLAIEEAAEENAEQLFGSATKQDGASIKSTMPIEMPTGLSWDLPTEVEEGEN